MVVEATEDGDHYDPKAKAVRLTEDKFNGKSLTAITVAAHEVGHALQDHENYGPLRLRTRLVKATRHVEKLGAGVLIVAPFIGIVTRAPFISLLTFAAGLATLGTAAVIHFVTLPTEFNASFARALPLLEEQRILRRGDGPHASKLLTACGPDLRVRIAHEPAQHRALARNPAKVAYVIDFLKIIAHCPRQTIIGLKWAGLGAFPLLLSARESRPVPYAAPHWLPGEAPRERLKTGAPKTIAITGSRWTGFESPFALWVL